MSNKITKNKSDSSEFQQAAFQSIEDCHRHLRGGKKSLLKKLGWDKTPPVLWSVPHSSADLSNQQTQTISDRHARLVKKPKRVASSDAVVQWRDFQPSDSNDLAEILGWLQLGYSLDQLAKQIDVSDFCELCQCIVDASSRLAVLPELNLWEQQLVNVELPLIVRLHLNKDNDESIVRFEQAVESCLDGDGWIESKYVDLIAPLVACWARSVELIQMSGSTLESSVRLKLEWMTRQWLKLVGPDGQLMLATSAAKCADALQESVLGMSSDRSDRDFAQARFGQDKAKSKTDLRSQDGCGYSEWAGMGVFQCNWKQNSPRVAIAATPEELRLEVCNEASLLQGVWDAEIKLNDEPVPLDSSRRQVNCYHTDDEVEFIEFEYDLGNESYLQRQLLLSRNDQFLLMADVVVPGESCRIDYRSSVPLADGIEVLEEEENSEVYLKDSRFLSLVLPLGLGEWKSDRSAGRFTNQDRKLVLEHSLEGRALYAPLFLDLSSKRCSQPRTWRRLTVAENLQILARDQAASYRVHIGSQQWLIYRSLSGVASRTFLGENQICEFYIGRTNGDDAAEEILQIV